MSSDEFRSPLCWHVLSVFLQVIFLVNQQWLPRQLKLKVFINNGQSNNSNSVPAQNEYVRTAISVCLLGCLKELILTLLTGISQLPEINLPVNCSLCW